MDFNSKNELQPLSYYILLAKKTISLFGGNVRTKMLKDEQAIGDVANEIMLAELKFDSSKDTTRKTWLTRHGIHGIQDYRTKLNKELKCCEINELCADKDRYSTANHNEDTEYVNSIINKTKLSERQKYCLNAVYFEKKKLREVSEELGLSIQAIKISVDKAIAKLKENAKNF